MHPLPDPVRAAGPVALRPGLEVVAARVEVLDLPVQVRREHAVLVNVGAPYRLVETLDGRAVRTRGAPGDVAVVPAGHALAARALERAQTVTTLVLLLAPDLVGEALASAGLPVPDEPLQAVVGARSPAVARLARLVADGLPAAQGLDRLALDGLATALVATVVREHRTGAAATAPAPAGLPAAALARVLQHVEERLGEPLTVAGLAAVAHVSPFHFSRQFRTATGTSPHRYVVTRRVARARELLTGSRLPLPEVAARCGFADQSHLGRVLRRELGRTPGQLRGS